MPRGQEENTQSKKTWKQEIVQEEGMNKFSRRNVTYTRVE